MFAVYNWESCGQLKNFLLLCEGVRLLFDNYISDVSPHPSFVECNVTSVALAGKKEAVKLVRAYGGCLGA